MPTKVKRKQDLHEYEEFDAEHGLNWDTQKGVRGEVILGFPQMGPLVGITHRKKIQFTVGKKTRTFTVVVHAAYNAFGLIGTEVNGVGVLDEDNHCVLVSGGVGQSSGYFGPSQAQIDEWKRVCDLSYEDFVSFINNHPMARYGL